jgi:hypothetical protein
MNRFFFCRKNSVLIIIFTGLLLPPWLFGATYYVSQSSGNDENDGRSAETAWQNIEKVNNGNFLPGDSILFKRSDTWREELVISWSGEENNPITFGTYGIGDKPQILASENADNWSTVAGTSNIWRSATSLERPDMGKPASIFFVEAGETVWGRTLGYSSIPTCDSSYSILQEEYDWCWDNGIVVYATENPATLYSHIEVPQRRGSITMRSHQPKEHIVIDGFEMMFGTMYGYNDGWPMNYEVQGLTIKNCHIGYIGIRNGASAMGLVLWHSEMLVQNNDIHDCGRRSISYNIYTDNDSQPNGLVFENVIFENNSLHRGFHTTGFDISHGDNRQSILRNFTFRNNLIYDEITDNPNDDPNDYTSMGLYLWTGAATFDNFHIYNNVLKNIKQKGFAIGGDNHLNLEIHNNVLYGMNPNIDNYRAMAHIGGNHQNLKFYNNIMFGTVDLDDYPCRGMYYGGESNGIALMDNNIYYQLDSSQQILEAMSKSYHMDDWAEYKNDTGWEQSGPAPTNPLFINPNENNFRLQPTSKAIDAGRENGLEFTGSAPDIGLSETANPGVQNEEEQDEKKAVVPIILFLLGK